MKENPLYSKNSDSRISKEKTSFLEHEEYRSNYRRDYARLIHSCGFRRLQGKTQMFPGKESDFFRNRLTHSLEVAQIAKSIAIRLNNRASSKNKKPFEIDLDLVEFSGTAHDLGHPPFGHQGERALNEKMRSYGGFEGNAQTLRMLTKIEKKFYDLSNNDWLGMKKDNRIGLNLTYRCLASILKYDKKIPNYKGKRKLPQKIIKGYYSSEADIVNKIKKNVLNNKFANVKFKTIECQIMDIADDIAYSTYDLEDSLKAGFFNPYDMLFPAKRMLNLLVDKVAKKLKKQVTEDNVREVLKDVVFKNIITPVSLEISNKLELNEILNDYFMYRSDSSYRMAKKVSKNGYLRVDFTSGLIGTFIRNVELVQYNENNPCLSIVELKSESKLVVEVLKQFCYISQVLSPKISIAEYRGKKIVTYIFEVLDEKEGYKLLPDDFRKIYDVSNKYDKKRIICDFIAGMTDSYATEFYGRLISENPETMFKPF